VEPEFFADGQTDRQTDVMKLMAVIHSFAHTPKKYYFMGLCFKMPNYLMVLHSVVSCLREAFLLCYGVKYGFVITQLRKLS
jgi:hypothetical protein